MLLVFFVKGILVDISLSMPVTMLKILSYLCMSIRPTTMDDITPRPRYFKKEFTAQRQSHPIFAFCSFCPSKSWGMACKK